MGGERPKAVFLSYASQDAQAAQRLCEAFQKAGIEVWFDQSELRGGDAWDHEIRQQIRDCALFIPIVSRNTQLRTEGYFRLEWRLADQRTHLMANSRIFLLPVCIDDTNDSDVDVPESFRAVQWTRLPQGKPREQFVERVLHLVSPEKTTATWGTAKANGLLKAASTEINEPSGKPRPRQLPRTAWMLAVAALIVVGSYYGAGIFRASKEPAESAVVLSPSEPPSGTGQNAIPEKSIAVLAFTDLSEKQDQEYFSDGLSEELIGLLSKIPDLHVPARTSSFYFKHRSDDIATISQKLRVAYVLEGSVRKAGDTIRVAAQLIRAENGYHLWSETYDRELADVFKVQDEIASAVVAALKLKLDPAGQAAGEGRTSIPEAYNEYLLGRQFFYRVTVDDFRRAAQSFRNAIALDPEYGAAYADLALAEFFYAVNSDDKDGFRRARIAAAKAVELAPEQADGYAARGLMNFSVEWDWDRAQADFEKALALDPLNSATLWQYGALMGALGRREEAIAVTRKATALDPLSNPAWVNLGGSLVASGRLVEAEAAIRRALEIQPESIYGLNSLASVQLLARKASDALAMYRRLNDMAGIAKAEHSLGNSAQSQRALETLLAEGGNGQEYAIATVYAWRGENDQAMQWLERAYQERRPAMVFVKDDQELAGLRGDSRFKAILEKMHLR